MARPEERQTAHYAYIDFIDDCDTSGDVTMVVLLRCGAGFMDLVALHIRR